MEATFVRFSYDIDTKDIIMEVVDFPKMYDLLQDKEGTLEEWDTFHKEMSEGLTKFLTEYRSRELDGTPTDFELTGYPNRVVVDLSAYESTPRKNKNDFVEALREYVSDLEMVQHTYHSPLEHEEGPTIACFLDYTVRSRTNTEKEKADKFIMFFDWEVV